MNITKILGQFPGCGVAGGYARDIAHGAIPKDCDVAVYGSTRDDVAAKLVTELLAHGYRVTGESEEYNGDAPDRYDNIIQPSHDDYMDVDLLVMAEQYTSITSVLADLDYNINMYYLDRAGWPVFTGSNRGELVRNRQAEVSFVRRAKMQAKAISLGWSPA